MSEVASERTAFTLTKTIHHDTYDAINPARHDHTGKAVFITGASKGIGKSIAIAYAQAGASLIAIAARSKPGLLEVKEAMLKVAKDPASLIVLPIALDITDSYSVDSARNLVKTNFGRLDIFINNAGYVANFAYIANSDPSDWWKVWEVNVKGPYLLARAFLPILLEGEGKTFINISSAAVLGSIPDISAYTNSKFAMLKFVSALEAEYGSKGLLAYSVHPGSIPTDMSHKMPEDMWHILQDTVELPAHTLVWLTNDRKEWLEGRYVSCNWDSLELESMKKEIVEKDLLKMNLAI